MFTRRALLGGAAIPLVWAVRDAIAAPAAAGVVRAPAGGARHLPNIPLVTHDEREVYFYDDLMKDKIVLVNFFYTRCDGKCLPIASNLRKVQDRLGDRVGRDIFMYSISLKPKEDRPKELRTFMYTYDVKPGWTFLTGSAQNCDLIRRRMGFADVDPAVDRDVTQHSGLVVLGNEAIDRWTACPAVSNPSEIVKYVSWLEL